MHEVEPHERQPTLRVRTTPNDANQQGDIFGGWLMSHIDIAGAIEAKVRARGDISTVAVKELLFLKPLFVYDLVSFYTQIEKVGNTSITVNIEVFATRMRGETFETIKVSDATLVYVAISKPGIKRVVPK